jgi:hypothetical protein
MPKTIQANKAKIDKKEKRAYISQEDIPLYTLESSIKIAQALYDNFGSKGASPHQVAIALEISPTSSSWKLLTGSSVAYGLTSGGAQANEISLAPLGKRIVAPEHEGDDEVAKAVACLRPRIIKEFFDRYDKNKFPKDVIGKNVIATLGVPKDKVDDVYDIILENGKYAGIIQDTKTGLFVFVEKSKLNPNKNGNATINGNVENNDDDDVKLPEDHTLKLDLKKSSTVKTIQDDANQKTKVFISHGKNKKIVDQLKEILTFGQFEVIVSVEKESTAIPVPEKVFADMRECNAAVIHVEGEKKEKFTLLLTKMC